MKSTMHTRVFNNHLALNIWKEQNYPFVRVLSTSGPHMAIGYNIPHSRDTPGITVSYVEFPRPDSLG